VEDETKSVKRLMVEEEIDDPSEEIEIASSSYEPEYAADSFDEEFKTEPTFVEKLRIVLGETKKNGNDFDKALATLGIVRISSRTTLQEPSMMRKEIKKILTDEEYQEIRAILALPKVNVIPAVKGDGLQNLRRSINRLELETVTDARQSPLQSLLFWPRRTGRIIKANGRATTHG